MGGGASKYSALATVAASDELLGTKTSSAWTKEEEEQNKQAEELQHFGSSFVAEYMFSG